MASRMGLPSPPYSSSSGTPVNNQDMDEQKPDGARKNDNGKARQIEEGLTPARQEATSEFEDRLPEKGGTGVYLEDLSKQIIEINLNQRDNNHPIVAKHMAPSFRGKHDALPKVNNRDVHQDNLKKHLESQPNLSVDILNQSSDVDDSRGRATVYTWYALHGLEHGHGRESVAVFSWEKKQGTWMIIKHAGMRGPAGFWYPQGSSTGS